MPKRLSNDERADAKAKKKEYQRQYYKRRCLEKQAQLSQSSTTLPNIIASTSSDINVHTLNEEIVSRSINNGSNEISATFVEANETVIIDEAWSRIFHDYTKAIEDGLTNRCYICDRLWFKSSILKIPQQYRDFATPLLTVTEHYEICQSCYKSVKNYKIPTIAAFNGFTYPPKPNLPKLNMVEERLIALRVPFMQIRKVGKTMQSKITGSIINVPTSVNTMLESIPRSLFNDHVVNVNFKKRINYKSNYISGIVNADHIQQWVNHLINSELYSENNVRVTENWLTEYVTRDDIDENSYLEIYEDDELIRVQQTLLFDRDFNIDMAPAEHNHPISVLADSHAEEMSFPQIFFGVKQRYKNKTTVCQIAKSEAARFDRRGARSDHILYLAAKSLRHRMISSINIAMKQTKFVGLTAGEARVKENIDVAMDQNFAFMKGMSSTPQYWHVKKRNLRAMIRTFGRPTVFLTMSAAEFRWCELIAQISAAHGEAITVDESEQLSFARKCEIVNSDSVMCAAYFDYKVRCIFKTLKKHNGPFYEHPLDHYFTRVEFQHRGSPHIHSLLWLKNAPNIDDKPTDESIANFVDKIITCNANHSNVVQFQTHKHSFTCYKKRRNICRFGIPFFPMDRTRILTPFVTEDKAYQKRLSDKNTKVREAILAIKLPTAITFDEFLDHLQIDIDQYILCIRVKLNRDIVALRRTPNEIFVNNYSSRISEMLNANMDIQFILNDYACASYCVDYINKVNRGISDLHREIQEELKRRNSPINLRDIGAKTLGTIELSAQEAAWHLLSLSMCEFSTEVIFIPTFATSDRHRMLKSVQELERLEDDSVDIFRTNILDRYANRNSTLETTCLAEYAAWYTRTEKRRTKARVIMSCNFRRSVNELEFFREQVMLYIPWRNEITDTALCARIYAVHQQTIANQRTQYSFREDYEEIMERHEIEYIQTVATQEAENEREIDQIRRATENREVTNEEFPADTLNDDIEADANDLSISRITLIPLQSHTEYCLSMRSSNNCQRSLLNDILDHKIHRKDALYRIITGPAGAGKTFLISRLQEMIRRIHRKQTRTVDEKVIMCVAPTGKAAFAMRGLTVHAAFLLPLRLQKISDLTPIEGRLLQKCIIAYKHLEYLIVDEVSMLSRIQLEAIHLRLEQFKQNAELFGGISILAFGDFNQLPPVASPPVYRCRDVIGEWLWGNFKSYVLSEIMRQRENKLFAQALTNYGNGVPLTDNERNMIESRFCQNTSGIPENCLYLFYTNSAVEAFNKQALSNVTGKVCFIAKDEAFGDASDEQKARALRSVRKQKRADNNGLEHELELAIDIPYMITVNVKVEDGLVNGAIGKLKYIERNSSEQIYRLWLMFDEDDVGRSERRKVSQYMQRKQIPSNLVPIGIKTEIVFRAKNGRLTVKRSQFPLTVAKALTIHKSQGATYHSVAFECTSRMSRKLIYVAMSRVTNPNNLFYFNSKNLHRTVQPDVDWDNEKLRLETCKHESPFAHLHECSYNFFFVYHNVQSLIAHVDDIKNDSVFMRADILMFAETWLKATDIVCFEDFYQLSRIVACDDRRKAGGVSLYGKEKYRNLFEKFLHYNDENIQACSVYLRSKVRYCVYYCHPNTSITTIRESLQLLLPMNTEYETVIVGDFNFEMNSETGIQLIQILQQMHCELRTNPRISTTTSGTCIDAIFSTRTMNAGTYVSYWSHHLPLYGYY